MVKKGKTRIMITINDSTLDIVEKLHSLSNNKMTKSQIIEFGFIDGLVATGVLRKKCDCECENESDVVV